MNQQPRISRHLLVRTGFRALLVGSLLFISALVMAGDQDVLRLPLEIMEKDLPAAWPPEDKETRVGKTDDQAKQETQESTSSLAKEVTVGSDTAFQVFWGNGLQFQTAAEDFRVHVGGRFDADWASFLTGQQLQFGPGGVGELPDGAEFRRARFRIDGTAFEVIGWIAECDFATAFDGKLTQPTVTDMYFEIMDLPVVGTFRAGHFREPFGLEGLSSVNSLTFLERSTASIALVPLRNLGFMLFDSLCADRANWEIGVFRTNSANSGNPSDLGNGELAVTARLSGQPWYQDNGRYLLHLGVACSQRNFSRSAGQEQPRFITYPEVRVGRNFFADTGNIPAASVDLLGTEFALNLGPLSVQSEYLLAVVNDAWIGGQVRRPVFHGCYLQASFFLTGEHRGYRRSPRDPTIGVFDRPRIFENFFLVWAGEKEEGRRIIGGKGAWEIALRYSWLDVNDPDQGVPGQILHGITIGLNWYLNNHTRLQWNYIIMDRNNPPASNDGVAHIFATRFHFDF